MRNMKRLLLILVTIGLLFSCKKEELPDAEPVAIINEFVTLNIHAKSLSSSGVLNPLLGSTISLYLSAEDRSFSENLYYESTTNTAGTATFTEVMIGDHIYLRSTSPNEDIELIDFEIGNLLVKNVEVVHSF